MTTDYLESVEKIINEKYEDFSAAINHSGDNDEYLMHVVKKDEYDQFILANGLVVMYDYGITWEPAKARSTPHYCDLDQHNAKLAARQLVTLANALAEDKLPR